MKFMKRSLPIILVFAIMLVFSVPALAFTFDFSPYSNEELIVLETALQKEKLDRGIAKSANVPAGSYTIGEDIPAGDYSIELANGQAIGVVMVNDGLGAMYSLTSDNPTVGKISLSEGDSFETICSIVLTIYSGGISFN